MSRFLISIIGLALVLLCLGCRQTTSSLNTSDAKTASVRQTDSPIVVRDNAGKSILLLTPADKRYDVTTAVGTVGSLKVKEDCVNLYTPQEKKIGSVKRDSEDFKLDDESGKKIAKLSSKDGGYRLKDATSTSYLKIKPRDRGFKVSDGNGQTLGKGRCEGDTISISDANGKSLYEISGTNTEVTGVLMTKKLTPMQQAAFILAATTLSR